MLTKQFYTTSIGKKILMAVSGLVLVFFITGHLLIWTEGTVNEQQPPLYIIQASGRHQHRQVLQSTP